MKIAHGAAKGLAFLHSDKAKVIYRDFKTSNILLDAVYLSTALKDLFLCVRKISLSLDLTVTQFLLQNYDAKLSDFGLAKDGPTGDKSHVSTRVMGTYGYAAPEYLATGRLVIPLSESSAAQISYSKSNHTYLNHDYIVTLVASSTTMPNLTNFSVTTFHPSAAQISC